MNYRQHCKFKFLVFIISIGGFAFVCANDHAENHERNFVIEKELHPPLGIEIHEEYIKQFSEDFCQFILETAPEEINNRLVLIRDPFCPLRIKPRRMLLYGPSGSGKTTLAQVIAQELNLPYIFINGGLLGNEYKNSAAQNLRRAIEPFLYLPCIVIIDEIDCILKQSKNEKDPDLDVPKQIWEILDICLQHPNIILIGITNDVKGMAEPLQTRFAGDTIEIPLATTNEVIKKIILFHLKDFPHECSESYLDKFSKQIGKYSYREVEKVVMQASAQSYLRNRSNPLLIAEDLNKASEQVEKSRLLLKQWSWADYEKPLQFGTQIAGLALTAVGIIISWKMASKAYLLSEEAMKCQQDTGEKSLGMQSVGIELQKISIVQAEQLAKGGIKSSEGIAAKANEIQNGWSQIQANQAREANARENMRVFQNFIGYGTEGANQTSSGRSSRFG